MKKAKDALDTSTDQANTPCNFFTGIDVIDSGHRMLVLRLSDLDWAIGSRCSKEIVVQFFADFGELALRHFEQEERVLQAVAYPDLEPHREEHRALMRALEQYTRNFMQNGPASFSEALVFLEEWTADHLMKADVEYIPFLTRTRPAM